MALTLEKFIELTAHLPRDSNILIDNWDTSEWDCVETILLGTKSNEICFSISSGINLEDEGYLLEINILYQKGG